MTGPSLPSLIHMVEHLPTPVVLTDPEGHVVGASGQATTLLGDMPVGGSVTLDDHLASLASPLSTISRTRIGSQSGAHDLIGLAAAPTSDLREPLPTEDVAALAGRVAHEFNNLLGVILNFATLAAGGVEPGSVIAADLGEVLAATNRASEITQDLMRLSFTLAPEPTDD